MAELLLTFDPQRKAYRSWWFHSDGGKSKSAGAWDDVAHTMTFQSDPANDVMIRTEVRFIDKDNEVWTVIAKDRDDKLYLDLRVTATRHKK